MRKIWITIILVVGLIGGVVGGYYLMNSDEERANNNSISNFEECAQAGNIIQESYPAVCRTPDGRSFTQEIDQPIGD